MEQGDDTPRVDRPASLPAASGAPGQADTIRSVLQQHGLSGAEATPAATSEPVVDSVFASHADDPQEEPFQRDGRWTVQGDPTDLVALDEALQADRAAGALEVEDLDGLGQLLALQDLRDLAAEDARFFRHSGVAPLGIARAAWQWPA